MPFRSGPRYCGQSAADRLDTVIARSGTRIRRRMVCILSSLNLNTPSPESRALSTNLVKMLFATNIERPVRYRHRRQRRFVERVLGEPLERRAGSDDRRDALLALEVDPPVGEHRR